MSQLKYLVNLSDEDFEFQCDSIPYTVPARSRKIFPAIVADHGEVRSVYQTDPSYNKENGQLEDVGGLRVKRCVTEPVTDTQPLDRPAEPIRLDAVPLRPREAGHLIKPLSPNLGGHKIHPALSKKPAPVKEGVPAKEDDSHDAGDNL